MRALSGFVAPAALAIALVSMAMNLYLFAQLRNAERWALPAAERALASLADAEGTLSRTITIPAGTEIDLRIPIDEEFTIEVDTLIPIATTVRVPFDTPIGRRSVTIPIRADVPLRASLPLDIEHTFHLQTRTHRPLDIPLRLRVSDLLDPSGGRD